MFDNFTLSIVFIMISFLLILSLVFNLSSGVRYPGTVIWTVGVVLIMVAFFGLAYQMYLPKSIGVVLTNCLTVSGFVCFLAGADRFYGKRNKGFLYFVPVAITMISFLYFTYIYESTKIRIIIISFVFILLLIMTIITILTGLPKKNKISFAMPVIGFGVYLIFSIIRMISSFYLPEVNNIQATGFALSMTFFLAIFSITIVSLSLLVITKARFENDLLLKHSELEYNNQTKDKLFSIISHDLKGPVGATASLIDIIIKQHGNSMNEQLLSWIKTIKVSTDNTYSLLINLLRWAESQRKVIKFNPDVIPLDQVVNRSIDILKSQSVQKNLLININLPLEIYIKADFSLTETVIRNIVSNAIKYSYSNASIDISYLEKGDLCGIAVKDYGTGITEDRMKNLFTLNSLDSKPGTNGESGTGFGLILSKEFMDMNSGLLEVESTPEKGTTFKLYFIKSNPLSNIKS